MRNLKLLLCALCVAWLAPGASAGTVIEVTTERLDNSNLGGKATLYIDAASVRVDSDEGEGTFTIIYRFEQPEKPFYWIIDRKQNAYYEITRADMEDMKANIEQATAAFEKNMKNVPPDQREQLKSFYKMKVGHTGEMVPRATYKKVSSGVKVGQWECDQYEGYRGDQKLEEVWATAWNGLGVEKREMKALYQMADLFESVGQDMPAFFQFGKGEEKGEVSGFPILVVTYEGGARKEKSQVEQIRSEDLSSNLFELPEGLQKAIVPKQ
jgi:hypothetical protein